MLLTYCCVTFVSLLTERHLNVTYIHSSMRNTFVSTCYTTKSCHLAILASSTVNDIARWRHTFGGGGVGGARARACRVEVIGLDLRRNTGIFEWMSLVKCCLVIGWGR